MVTCQECFFLVDYDTMWELFPVDWLHVIFWYYQHDDLFCACGISDFRLVYDPREATECAHFHDKSNVKEICPVCKKQIHNDTKHCEHCAWLAYFHAKFGG